MQITRIKAKKFFDEGSTKAVFSAVFNGQLVIDSLKLIYSRDRFFVKFPRKKNHNGTYSTVAYPITAELKNTIESEIVAAYKAAVESEAEESEYLILENELVCTNMQVTDIKINEMFEEGPVKANVSVTFDDQLVVENLELVFARDRFFVWFPYKENRNGIMEQFVHSLSLELTSEIESKVIAAYKTACE